MTLRAADGRLVASISLDLDNLWTYLKIHGDAAWSEYPSFIPVVVPRLLDLFGEHGISGTVFVVGRDAEAGDDADGIRQIAAAGHELGSHSYSHEPWLHRYTRTQIDEELSRTEEALERLCGARPRGFRAPGYSLSPTLLEALAARGYTYDASTLPTWIGPMARAYYFRTAELSDHERQTRSRLFGQVDEVMRPVHPYRWATGGGDLIELPVTTVPLARVPMHFSYVLWLHGHSPTAARAYFRSALRLCVARGLGPSLLLHPLDLLGPDEAAGAGFFPGMGVPTAEKHQVVSWALREMATRFAVVGTGAHAAALSARSLPTRRPPDD